MEAEVESEVEMDELAQIRGKADIKVGQSLDGELEGRLLLPDGLNFLKHKQDKNITVWKLN